MIKFLRIPACSMRSASRLLLFASILLSAGAAGQPQQDDPNDAADSAFELDPVTVVSYRQPRSLSEVAGTITVFDRNRIERDLALDIQDLVRYEPGVEVDGGGTRFGFGGFRIRGLGGNRTALVVDNVPTADRFSVGNFADTGRGLLELGLVSRVEILRGPASTIYGSKALGGVVAVSLLEADDLLLGSDQASRLELAGGSENNRLRATAAHATRNNGWSGILAASAQTSDEIDVAGLAASIAEDQLERDQGAFVFRAARETDLGRFRLTLDGTREERDSDIRALLGSGRFRNTTSLAGDDRQNQWRVLLDHHFDEIGPIDRGQWRLWHQVTDTLQQTEESRPLAPNPVDLFRRFEFRQENTGLGADLETDLRFAGFQHRIGYGFEVVRSDLEQLRSGTQTNRETGEVRTDVLGERFPLRDFPKTEVTEAGIYLYDEIRLWPGGPMLSPGARFEYYELDSKPDPLFTGAFPDAEIVDLDTTAWAPRVGLVWPVIDELDLFFQFARGFRSPPFEDVNIGLDIPQFGVRAIPNPDLEPERGHTLEAGIRYRSGRTLLDLAVFRNRFKDFIDTRALVGFDPVAGLLLFQSINRDRVEIEGAELRARQNLGLGFDLELAAEWTRGEDRNSDRSLAGISPPQAIAAISYAPIAAWEIRFITTATRSQRRLEDEQGNPLFSAPGSTVFDLTGRWNITPDLKLSLGIFNLTDKRWFNHANVINRPAGDPTLPLLAEPGTNARATLSWAFN
ncbi:MAG: TonB-dependent receptor [Wenzhouxiangellaceae bacterium]|nr:TonB-dependent receptor [Wenzhouxiangellaceae bacterium]